MGSSSKRRYARSLNSSGSVALRVCLGCSRSNHEEWSCLKRKKSRSEKSGLSLGLLADAPVSAGTRGLCTQRVVAVAFDHVGELGAAGRHDLAVEHDVDAV